MTLLLSRAYSADCNCWGIKSYKIDYNIVDDDNNGDE
jgi:hypothetical protein